MIVDGFVVRSTKHKQNLSFAEQALSDFEFKRSAFPRQNRFFCNHIHIFSRLIHTQDLKMKNVYTTLGFALGASAATLSARDSCCFSLTASGGKSGVVGQLGDGTFARVQIPRTKNHQMASRDARLSPIVLQSAIISNREFNLLHMGSNMISINSTLEYNRRRSCHPLRFRGDVPFSTQEPC
jgi:hypothetical protein